MSAEPEPTDSNAMEQADFLELATDSASLIHIQSLDSIFVKAGYDRPDFVINPTREKVSFYAMLLFSLFFLHHAMSTYKLSHFVMVSATYFRHNIIIEIFSELDRYTRFS